MKNNPERPGIALDGFWAQLAIRFEAGAVVSYVLLLIIQPSDPALWGLVVGAAAIAAALMIVEVCLSSGMEAQGDPIKAVAVLAATLSPVLVVVVSWGQLVAHAALVLAAPVGFAWYVWGRVLAPRQYPGPMGRVTLTFLVLSGAMIAGASIWAAYIAFG